MLGLFYYFLQIVQKLHQANDTCLSQTQSALVKLIVQFDVDQFKTYIHISNSFDEIVL